MKTSPSNRKVVSWAYEFALNHIGQDKDNGEIWCNYIQFIKAGKANIIWEEQQKMDALHKVYHWAPPTPTGIEDLSTKIVLVSSSLSPWTYIGRDKQPVEVDNWLYLTASGGWA
ncbi:hypothetical protein SCLCIDRAFT_32058 [Scleroderma citrinum Foug A]|uniref:mRNA 3'-end-processing protein RNA14 n=1 Tax=Scleroderma citrinum Foug A TaxID=1036808 RepID=A0A0C3D9Y7_9AGAM|nr:hypothetical protein SCLCIDRAFT_32058 [Scleroderma citrinum Foug A]